MPRLTATASSEARRSRRRARRIVAPTSRPARRGRDVHPEVGLAEHEIQQQEPAEADDAGRDAQGAHGGPVVPLGRHPPEGSERRLCGRRSIGCCRHRPNGRCGVPVRPMSRCSLVARSAHDRCPCRTSAALPRTTAPAQTIAVRPRAARRPPPLVVGMALGTVVSGVDGWLRRPGRCRAGRPGCPVGAGGVRGRRRRGRAPTGRPPRSIARAASSPAGSPAAVRSRWRRSSTTTARPVRRRSSGWASASSSAASPAGPAPRGRCGAVPPPARRRQRPSASPSPPRRSPGSAGPLDGRAASAAELIVLALIGARSAWRPWCSPAAAPSASPAASGSLALAVPTAALLAAAPALLALPTAL